MSFAAFRQAFGAGPLAAEMRATVEDSPWHREPNVWVHTCMSLAALDEELERTGADARTTLLAQLAVLYHDVGKPDAEDEQTRDDGTKYRRYSGHEVLSAAAFAQAWLTDPALRELLPSEQDARAVRLIIEHHLPYALKDRRKLGGLKASLERHRALPAFLAALRGDARGRVSDDHVLKLERVEWWIAEFADVPEFRLPPPREDRGSVRLLVGPSGAGKTTRIARDREDDDVVVSLDQARLDAFAAAQPAASAACPDETTRYALAWEWSIQPENEPAVEAVVRAQEAAARAALLREACVFVDATCLSRKRRARWVALAEATGAAVIATELWVAEAELLRRAAARPDKRLSPGVVRGHLAAQTCVLESEAHYACVEVVGSAQVDW